MLGRWQAIAQTADIADPHPNEVKDAAKDRSAAVAELCFVDAGRPDERQTKARHRRVAGWRPDEGREESGKLICFCERAQSINKDSPFRIAWVIHPIIGPMAFIPSSGKTNCFPSNTTAIILR